MKEKLKQFKPYAIGSIFTLLTLALAICVYIIYMYTIFARQVNYTVPQIVSKIAQIEEFITSDGQEGLAIAIKKIVVESLDERGLYYSPELESK